MTRADRVHSTPPLNASAIPSRRRFLAQSAIATAAIAAAVPAAVATLLEIDPIFAMINRHRELSAHYDAAVAISGKLLDGPEFDAADALADEYCGPMLDCSNELVYAVPTTLAGIVALVRYVGSLEDWQQPREDFTDWGQAFCNTIADAIENISVAG
jgi:hypothetical protein